VKQNVKTIELNFAKVKKKIGLRFAKIIEPTYFCKKYKIVSVQ